MSCYCQMFAFFLYCHQTLSQSCLQLKCVGLIFLFSQIRCCLSFSLSKDAESKYFWEREGCTNCFSFIVLEIGSLYALLCKTERAWTCKCPQDGTKVKIKERKFLLKLTLPFGLLFQVVDRAILFCWK